MKQLYITLLSFGFGISAFAQGYTINPSNTMDENAPLNFYTTTTINLVHDNLSTDSVEIYWEVVGNTMQAGWDYSWCAYLDCFGQNITSGTFDKFGPNQTAFFKVNLNPMSIVGAGQVKIRIFNTSTPGMVDTLTYNYNAILDIADIELGEKVKVYPNPFNGDQITVSGVLPNSHVEIVNALGQTMLSREFKSTASSLVLNDLNFRNGVYFIRLRRNGEIYTTRKLIVK
ncbi:MAG: T9SS type A sorting domain-containing protein [Crocinitomicaceae bacterium]|nr:T9SS type A sorting domain-containing protein [Crocinitomicaceae bacterium]